MTRAQEARFWETHDATDYLDEMEPVTATVGPRPRNRCSTCGQVMFSRYVDVDLAGGRAQLRQVRQLYCPDGCIEQDAEGYFVADLYWCKGCGICARECPTGVITMIEETE